MALDRTLPPQFHTIDGIELTPLKRVYLSNNQPCYLVNTGTQEAIKLEIVFDAGTQYGAKKAVAMFYLKLFLGGTTKQSSTELAEAFSQYGGFTEVSQTTERLSFTIFGLSNYLENFLGLIKEVIEESCIDEAELTMQKQIAVQQLRINQEKTAFVASQQLRMALFGENHPMGQIVEENDIYAVSVSDVQNFYELFVRNKPFSVFLSGNFTEKHIGLINNTLGNIKITDEGHARKLTITEGTTKTILVPKDESVQSSIRLGKVLFSRQHPDYFPFIVTNMVLGGYFGSRLMKNIREDKGFTYGISSSLVPLATSGYFMIGTDVKKEFTQQTLDEIAKEIAILQTELVSEEELETVKNYMAGQLAGSINTPFDIAEKHKTIVFDDLSESYYNEFISKIRAVTSEQILEIAQKYLSPSSMVEVVVGGK